MDTHSDPYKTTRKFFEKTKMRYGGRIISSIAIGILGATSLFYLNSFTNRLEQNLDIIPKVINAVQGEDGIASKSELQDFLKDIEIRYSVKEGDRLDLKSEYWSPIEVIIISEDNKRTIGKTDRLTLNGYLRKHGE